MKAYNIHEAKTQLSKLVQDAALGTPFVIAKAGTPQVLVQAFDAPAQPQRLGFMAADAMRVPDDFDRMGTSEIAALFGLDADLPGESGFSEGLQAGNT